MPEFKLSNGPWSEILSGKLQGHEIQVQASNEDVFASMVYEVQNGKKTGVLLELFKVYQVTGEMEHFVETLQRKGLGLLVHGEKNEKYLLIGSGPSYVKYTAENVNAEIGHALQSVQEISSTLKDVAKAYEVNVKELHEISSAEKELFYSTPLINLLFVPRQVIKVEKSTMEKTITGSELELGITKEGNSVREPLVLFKNVMVSAGKKNQRLHVSRVLMEGALLARMNVLVFAFENEFFGLGLPSVENKKLERYKIELEPLGFPVKEFEAGTDIRINVNAINVNGFADVFGMADEKLRDQFRQLLQAKPASLKEVIARAEKLLVSEQFTAFQKSRLVRMLKVIELDYPSLFDGEINMEDLIKSSHKTLGRASIINLRGKDQRKNLLIIESVLSSLNNYINENPNSGMNIWMVVPNAGLIVPREKVSATLDVIAQHLMKLSEQGIGFLLEAEHREDINEKVREMSTVDLDVVKENDVAVQIKGKKSYRCFIRPTFSKEAREMVEIIEV